MQPSHPSAFSVNRTVSLLLGCVLLLVTLDSPVRATELVPNLAYRAARPTPEASACAVNGPADLSAVANRWGLRLDASAGGDVVVLSGRGVRLALAPGLPLARLNQRTVRLPTAPAYRDGRLMVPEELLRLLPAPSGTGRLVTDCTVILDPGHGGRDPGAVGHGGVREKDVVLAVALGVRKRLVAQGVRVVMTRTGDTYPSLAARADLANRTPNAIFISIHANAARDRSARGVETFVLSHKISDAYRTRRAAARYRVEQGGRALPESTKRRVMGRVGKEARDESVALAGAVHGRLLKAASDSDRGVRRENFHVLRESYFAPAILVELGFLTHPASARQLADAEHQACLARALADGIAAHLAAHRGAERETAWATLGGDAARIRRN